MPHELITYFQSAQNSDLILPGAVAAIWLLFLLFTLLFYFRLSLIKIPTQVTAMTPVSVIMVERNEEENLLKNLPGWLSLEYPFFEVLVVDDFSEDNSLSAIGVLKSQYPRLKFTGLNQETRFSQKLSRNLALKGAAFDNVVFANPSMEMPGQYWLPGIASAFEKEKKIVVGYTGTLPAKGFYHKLFRIESFYQQINSMACCLNGLPYVVNEENIAFRKQAYFDINGFAGKMKEEYLNMEMIFNDVIRRKNNAVHPVAILSLRREIKAGRPEFRELFFKYFRLKSYLGTGLKIMTGFFNVVKLLLLPLFILCYILYPVLWMLLAVLLLVQGILMATCIKRLQNRLNDPKIFISSLIYGLVTPLFRLFYRWSFIYRRRNS